ncbi:PREDICTED: uncharacterized protein LOC106921728 [Poecilia mexicana]|uniref:uncharacterized protein LOC106921728 n=1 Tax=Poecilia mexicana TaxID=48701 RepID=UPI00072DBFD1|nr:PREDICTED: uncharacterized protein LOC106921728 [Poecilia mexicana]
METIPLEEISPQTEPTSPPSPKRARTDCAATEDLHRNSRFNSSQLQMSQDAISSLSTNNLQETDGLIIAKSGQYHDENLIGLPSDLTPASHVTSESNEVCVSVEREEKSFVTETDERSPASNSTPSLPVCKQLEKLLKDENPAVCLQNDGNDGNLGTWAQTQPSLVQAVTFCSHQAADTDFCHAFSQLADAAEGDLKREEAPLRSPTSSSQDALLLCSNVEADHSQKSDHQIPENVSDIETKGQGSKMFVNSSEGLIPCCEFESGTTTSSENVSFQEHNYVVEAEIPAAVRISQEAAKGDNEAGAFCVIDPVIWSEIDEEVERLLCNSDGAAGGELSPLVEVCDIEATYPPCSEARTSLDSVPDQTEQLQRDGNKISTNSSMQDQTDNEGKSSPAFAEDDGTGEICDTARSQLKVAVSPDHMEMPELEYSRGKTDEVEEIAGFIQSHSPKETETYELRNLESEWQNKQGDCNSNQKEGETQKHGSNLKSIDNKQENELGEAFGANICVTYVTTEGKEQNQKVKVGREINIDEQGTGECMQKQSEFEDDIREESPIQDVSEWAENRLSFYNGEDPEQSLGSFTHDVSTLHTVPPTTDAVVPCPSQNALHGFRYFSSDFTPGKDALGRFDTFEKIKLFPDDDDGATELLNTPQEEQEHHMQVAESEINEKTLEDKENTENGFVSSFSSSNEVPNFTPFLDKEPNSRSTNDSSHCSHDELNPQSASSAVPTDPDGPSCDLSTNFDFEMEEQFGRVLQELNLFFDISRNEFTRPPSPDLPEPSVDHSTKVLSSPELKCYAHTSTDKAVEDHGLLMCGLDPVVSCPVIRSDGEQEVPLNRNLEQEPSMDTTEKSKESQEAEQKVKVWSPSFMRLPDLEQLSHRPPELPRRLEPLRTCTRPIRVGLSKRAKTKQLHHAHPYK